MYDINYIFNQEGKLNTDTSSSWTAGEHVSVHLIDRTHYEYRGPYIDLDQIVDLMYSLFKSPEKHCGGLA